MPKQSINQIKQWFVHLSKPDQNEFWDLLDSYFHKDDSIPIVNITGLQNILDNLAPTNAVIAMSNSLNSLAPILLPAGATTYDVRAGTLIRSFCVIDNVDLSFSIGLTPEGKEYIADAAVIVGSEVLDVPKYFKNDTTIYFMGITPQTIIRITKG